jgi:hypothetical protein
MKCANYYSIMAVQLVLLKQNSLYLFYLMKLKINEDSRL